MFSLIMTALEKKLDPWQYLTWLIKNYDTAKDVEQLLPRNAPDDCKIQRFSLPPCRLRQVFLYAFRFDAYRYFYSPLDLTLTKTALSLQKVR